MRFIFRHDKSGKMSLKEVAAIEDALKSKYPSIEDVAFRSKGKVFFLRKRKQPFYKVRRRDPETNKLKFMRRPAIPYIPKALRSDQGYITAVPVEKKKRSSFREKHDFTRSTSSVLEQYYFISLVDVSDFNALVDDVTHNIIKDFKRFQRPQFLYARLHFIVRDRKVPSFKFARSSHLTEAGLLSYGDIRSFVLKTLQKMISLLQYPSKTTISDIILEKHEVYNSRVYPMRIRNI